MGKALDGLKGVSEHTFDNNTWIFTVTYHPQKQHKKSIIQAVEAAEEGFKVKNWKQIKQNNGDNNERD
ncbi:MAG: hypothetical protein ISR82_05230 [Candidatus Marinimicrobia bacterium]|nr:hypothetical protein [Candidatus Neomarinimicrobiota bacterium]MBL7010603.1 hypothetical protein [Candidatus Neomarinimicrobiota bacterium]MBL7030088.1 hypothetical protein [Candidatus Neomarinimicrobiota bacterium]